ncbi:MAG: metal-dependent transcriptional regulator [Eubacteriales bacterium]|nr:metal-dependent transcriptional regulator [Eubacteriales bacterium]
MKENESREMYLEAIYELEQQNGAVRIVDIAGKMGFSKPSVSRAISVLRKNGYIAHSPYGDVALTEKGRELARRVYSTHQLLTAFFTQILKLDPDVAEADACRIEHVISQQALDAIEAYLGARNQA